MPNHYQHRTVRRAMLVVAASTLILTACGVRQDVVTAPPAPQPAATPMPQPPAGAALVQSIPPLGADGRYVTPNHGLDATEALWHVRVALNVAALGCRNDPADIHRLNYNRFLAVHKATLARTNSSVDTQYRQRFGQTAATMRDTRTTRAYNFFALPPAQTAFCAAAAQVGTQLLAQSPDQLVSYAPAALQMLEQPFVEFYAAYAAYQQDLARWQSTHYASASGASMTPVAMTQASVPVQPAVWQIPSKPASVGTRAQPVSTAPVGATGRYVVQLGAYDSQDAARSAWWGIVGDHPEYPVTRLVTSSTTVNGRVFHRLAISGFATQGEAARTCATLKAKGVTCFARGVVADDKAVRWSTAAR